VYTERGQNEFKKEQAGNKSCTKYSMCTNEKLDAALGTFRPYKHAFVTFIATETKRLFQVSSLTRALLCAVVVA
jgi:hypothetical protein